MLEPRYQRVAETILLCPILAHRLAGLCTQHLTCLALSIHNYHPQSLPMLNVVVGVSGHCQRKPKVRVERPMRVSFVAY
jgi:hypothetical protein